MNKTTNALLHMDQIHAARLQVEKEIANFTYKQLIAAKAEAKAHNRSNDLLGYLVRKRLGYIK